MKPTVDQSVGSGQATYQPVLYHPAPVEPAPTTQPPGLGIGQPPVMRVIPYQVPTEIVWPRPADSSSASVPPSTPVQDYVATARNLAAKANEFRAAILAGRHEGIHTILVSPHINEIAMMPDAQGRHALFHAIEKNDLLILNSLLHLPSANAQALKQSSDGRIALDAAAAKGAAVGVRLLLSLSSAQGQVMVSTGEGSRRLEGNPLTAAVWFGHENVVRVLLDSPYAPAFVHGRSDEGNNALMIAVMIGNERMTRLLLASPYRTALVEAKNDSGCSALIHAALVGHVGIARALLEHQEVRWQLISSGTPLSPLDCATFKGHQGVAELFRQQIAQGMRVHLGSAPVTHTGPRQ